MKAYVTISHAWLETGDLLPAAVGILSCPLAFRSSLPECFCLAALLQHGLGNPTPTEAERDGEKWRTAG